MGFDFWWTWWGFFISFMLTLRSINGYTAWSVASIWCKYLSSILKLLKTFGDFLFILFSFSSLKTLSFFFRFTILMAHSISICELLHLYRLACITFFPSLFHLHLFNDFFYFCCSFLLSFFKIFKLLVYNLKSFLCILNSRFHHWVCWDWVSKPIQ